MTCSFVPPYLLRQLASGRQSGADAAAETLRRDHQLRLRRETSTPPQLVEVAATGRRVIYDAQNGEDLPGVVARTDDQPPTGDLGVDEAHTSSGQVWDLFANTYGRESVDGRGSTISVTVHYGTNYDNAFWDGERLVFGDGDGEIFDRFTKPFDVMAHEFTHGVVQYTAGLVYSGQSGALNESVADVFAALTKQQVRGETADQADWLVGVGLFLPDVNAIALRSMLEPGTAYDDPRIGRDPQVGSMSDFVETTDDNGGVHINSGIPNRAFALAAKALGGNSWERAGRIWYDALTAGEVTADSDFAAFAAATVSSATRLFPDDAEPPRLVADAWAEVGLAPGPPPAAVQQVSVRRSGGFAGTVRSGSLDLGADPRGREVRSLLDQVDLRSVAARATTPDRFVYTIAYGEVTVTVGEPLSPELARLVQIVLDRPNRPRN